MLGLLLDAALLFVIVKVVTKGDEDVLKLLLLAFGVTMVGVVLSLAGLPVLVVRLGYFVAVCLGLFLVANCSWLGALIAGGTFIAIKIVISLLFASPSDDESAGLARPERTVVAFVSTSEVPPTLTTTLDFDSGSARREVTSGAHPRGRGPHR